MIVAYRKMQNEVIQNFMTTIDPTIESIVQIGYLSLSQSLNTY